MLEKHAMPTRKSFRSRTRSARSKKSKFITPDLVLCAGQLIRFVANDDNPLSQAERLRSDYAELKDGDQESLNQFLQRVYYVAVQFRRFPREFERLQAHQFWKDSGQKPKDASTSKWVVYFIMQATPPNVPHRADQCVAILDSFMRNGVDNRTVAARIEQMGGVDAAYQAVRPRQQRVANRSRDRGAEGGDGIGIASRQRVVTLDYNLVLECRPYNSQQVLDGATLEPVRFRLDVTKFPADDRGWARIVCDEVTLISEEPSEAPRKRRVTAPLTKSALRLRTRLRAQRTRD
jgi:hypothetical protein